MAIEIKNPKYLGSWQFVKEMPQTEWPEFAFIGRSNVGKSSLINMLCGRKKLALTSSKPGKTQTMNLFDIDGKLYICDLPGYGYAKVSKTQRKQFSKMIENYLLQRPNLYCLFILIDMRIPPQESDIEFINRCGERGIPIILVGTKADKLSVSAAEASRDALFAELSVVWDEMPPYIISSSETKLGREELLKILDEAVKNNK